MAVTAEALTIRKTIVAVVSIHVMCMDGLYFVLTTTTLLALPGSVFLHKPRPHSAWQPPLFVDVEDHAVSRRL